MNAELEGKSTAAQEAEKVKASEAEATGKRLARQSWIASGGDPGKFEKDWPAIWADMVKEKTVAKVATLEAEATRAEGLRL